MSHALKMPLLELVPASLYFPPPLSRPITNVLVLHNQSKVTVAFKVKTTTPKRYCVKPRWGAVQPNSSVEIQITLHAMKEPVAIEDITDKFLVESAQITPEEQAMHHQDTLWKSLPKNRIIRQKLKCYFRSQVPANMKVVLLNDNSVLIHAQGTAMPNKKPVDAPEGDEGMGDEEEDEEREMPATLVPAPAPAPAPAPEPETETEFPQPGFVDETDRSSMPSYFPTTTTTENEGMEVEDLGHTRDDTNIDDFGHRGDEPTNVVPLASDEIESLESTPNIGGGVPVQTMERDYFSTSEPTREQAENQFQSEPPAQLISQPQRQQTPPQTMSVATTTPTMMPTQEPVSQWVPHDDKLERVLQSTRESLASRIIDTNVIIDQSELKALRMDQNELKAIRNKFSAVCEDLSLKKQLLETNDEKMRGMLTEIDSLKKRLRDAENKMKEGLRQRHAQKPEPEMPQAPGTTLDSNKYSLITLFIVAIIFFLIGKLL